MDRDRGKFITFEGIEGCGKSTQASRLAGFLRDKGVPCLLTKQPGGTEIGAMIRAILLDPAHDLMHPWCEALLYLADRCQHVHQVIRPHLDCGGWVVCDRYQDSTAAYQGAARRIGTQQVHDLFEQVTGGLQPDLTVLLDIDAETGLHRALSRNQAEKIHETEGRFENQELQFHQTVRRAFLDMARREPNRFLIVDGSRSADVVHADVIQSLSTRGVPHCV